MTNRQLHGADHAVLRMVLADIGAMERPFVTWLAEMEAIDPLIFHRLETAWIERFGTRVSDTFGLGGLPKHRNNLLREHVPLWPA